MKILAIDPSSTDLGWALFRGIELKAYGWISTKGVKYECRYMHIITELTDLLKKYQFTEIACENVFRTLRMKVDALSVAVTSIKKWAERFDIPVSLYYAQEWKSSVIGKGSASKGEVAQVIHVLYPELPENTSQHTLDAIAIGQFHCGVKKLEEMVKER